MTETVIEAIDDPTEETEEPIPQTEEEPKSLLEIKDWDQLKRVLSIVSGIDPDAQQAIAKFLDLASKTERSYFPDKITTICIAQLQGYSEALFDDEEDNPYTVVADALSVAYMAYKGFKSNQFVDMTRQTPNLEALKTAGDDVKQGLAARILGRGKGE